MLNLPETKLPCNYKSFVEVQANPKSKDEFAILADQALYFYNLKAAFQQVEQNNEDEEDSIQTESEESDDDKYIEVARLGPGQSFGELALLSSKPR